MEKDRLNGTSDLRELWESYLVESAVSHDVSSISKEDECCHMLNMSYKSVGVVLRDRLMTDAALGGVRPIKFDHSYSLLTESPDFGTVIIDNNDKYQDIISKEHQAITRATRIEGESPTNPSTRTFVSLNEAVMKGEESAYIEIQSEPNITKPKSPPDFSVASELSNDHNRIMMISPHRLHDKYGVRTSDSEKDDEDDEATELELHTQNPIKTEHYRKHRQSFPPTPPSSTSSDSEGAASCILEWRGVETSPAQNLGNFRGSRFSINAQPSTKSVHTSLISCQLKSSTGSFILTEEEKRTLIAEGYSVPTKLPLTKQEEKSLKKVRRKIKNKISAQESRRKKKEYMDGLERRVTMLTAENLSYRDRLTSLEDANRQLLKELKRFPSLLERSTS
ncbi:cyclic AMP response element-binding protein A-like [Fopius arisanus]|uniref:Cyclic AMP response element-binding protein A-like n=1 Tax=Fopius arisanus TaxID=64838 RepID=A0A9R1TKK2_9HYME|nr:PREDICTED: cyclic AMP response element-binding protein A-like [Fopius arisanus]